MIVFPAMSWLPEKKSAAVYLSIDDVHPAKKSDGYDAGGDLASGALGHLEWLLERHPQLRATIFLTADWREISPILTRKFIASIPVLRDHVYLAKRWPLGKMRVDRHPDFVRYLQSLPRTEIGLHGLHHCHPGPHIHVEFQNQSQEELTRIIARIREIFRSAGIVYVPGMCPPGWNAPAALLAAAEDNGLEFMASARDVVSPISETARTAMSGLRGVSLIAPEWIGARLIHLPSNFDATTPISRAHEIVRHQGVIGIKIHITKQIGPLVAKDGLDINYRNYLDVVLSSLEDEYGDSLWWTSMSDVSARMHQLRQELARQTA